MKPLMILSCVLLVGCTGASSCEREPTVEQRRSELIDKINADQQRVLEEAAKLTYDQPDFEKQRVFLVEDQSGCKWWMTSGHKFDQTYIALSKEGRPICPLGVTVPSPEHY